MEVKRKKQIIDVMGADAYDISGREIAILCPLTYSPELMGEVDLYTMERSDKVGVTCGLAFIRAITVVEGFMYNLDDNNKPYAGSFVGIKVAVVKKDMTHVEMCMPLCTSKSFNRCMEQMTRYIVDVKGDKGAALQELHDVVEALVDTIPSIYIAIN